MSFVSRRLLPYVVLVLGDHFQILQLQQLLLSQEPSLHHKPVETLREIFTKKKRKCALIRTQFKKGLEAPTHFKSADRQGLISSCFLVGKSSLSG